MNPTNCYASKSIGHIIDVIDPDTGKTAYSKQTLAEVQERHPDAEHMSIEDFIAWKTSQQRTPITWSHTTKEQYHEMLNVLPPAEYARSGFLVGEPVDHDAGNGQPRFEAYRYEDHTSQYLVSSRPMTILEFKTEMLKSPTINTEPQTK